MDEVKEGIKYIFQTLNDATMCISGSGHCGMEASLCNLIEDNDVVLMGITGMWGHRAADMARRYGADVRYMEASFGRALTLEEIRFAFDTHKPRIFSLPRVIPPPGFCRGTYGKLEKCVVSTIVFWWWMWLLLWAAHISSWTNGR